MTQAHILEVLKNNPDRWFTTKMLTRNKNRRSKIAKMLRKMESFGFIDLKGGHPFELHAKIR